MSWRKNLRRIKIGEIAVGLIVVVAIGVGSWLINSLIISSFRPLARPMSLRSSSPEPSRLEQYSAQAQRLFEKNADWLVGAGLSVLTLHFLWLAGTYVYDWKRSDKAMLHPMNSWDVVGGLLGFGIFGYLTLAWIQTLV